MQHTWMINDIYNTAYDVWHMQFNVSYVDMLRDFRLTNQNA